jgi:hypothetical protein
MQRIKLLFLFFFASFTAIAQSVPLSDHAKVSVLTCGNGNEMYSLFGHTAIRIKDAANNLDVVYNYGAFDFGTPNFVLRFTKGDMQYFVTAGTYDDFVYQYNYEKRSVSEQELNIPQHKKQELFETLNAVLFSDERFYTYKFIDRNCTNMAVDVLNKTLGEKAIYKRKNTDVTYRETIFPYFNGHFYEQLGTSIIFGAKVDEKATLLFLPIELEQSLESATYENHLLAKKSRALMRFDPVKENSWWNNIYTFLALLAVVVLVNRKAITATYLILIAALGLFFSIAGWYSLHEELDANYNILLFNPLLFALLFFWFRKNQKWTRIFAMLSLAMIAVYAIVAIAKVYFWIVLPVIATNTILLVRILRKNKLKETAG